MEATLGSMTEGREGRSLSWKVFGVLMVGALVGALGILPYAFVLQSEALANVQAPLWVLVVASVIQTLLLAAAATALGLWLGGKIGLGAPLLRAWLAGEPGAVARIRAVLPTAVILGALAGLLIIVLDGGLFAPLLGEQFTASEAPSPGAWRGFLASFYGGIVEELLLRLGLMTALAWIGTKLTRAERPGSGVMWVALLLAALLFGAGHLPAAAAIMPLTPVWVTRILFLNSVGGVVFGWLYWRKGLVAAIAAHFCADLVLHVIAPLLAG